MCDFSKNPSVYDGKLIEENNNLKKHLKWCIELLEHFPMETSHEGPCSPPATNCDGACSDAYYFHETLSNIKKIIN